MIPGNEQYDHQSFFHLTICYLNVAEKYGKADIALWTNGDYIQLSSILYHNTNVQISPSTLKRIFGKLKTTESYYPQKATRDALANYAGFEDWENFVRTHPIPRNTEDVKPPEPVTKEISRKRNWLLIVLILAVMLTITIWKYSKKENQLPVGLQDIRLICKNPIGTNPHSADFIIELPKKFTGDSTNFAVNFDDGKMEKKEFAGALFTYYYEIPGRYYPVLKYKGVPIDTTVVYLKTNGWTTTAVMQHDTTRVYPINSNLIKNSYLTVNAAELFYAGVDTNRTFFVHFVNSKPLNISGDNFELTTDVTTSRLRPGVRCSQVNIEVYGQESMDAAVIIKSGCVSWAYLRFSEVFIDGGKSDLRSIGADLSQGGIIKLRVVNKKVNLFVNHKLVYKTAYQFPLNKIYGIRITFSGIGVIHNLVLKDLNTGELFHEGFPRKIEKQY